jgi:hypothetical protein
MKRRESIAGSSALSTSLENPREGIVDLLGNILIIFNSSHSLLDCLLLIGLLGLGKTAHLVRDAPLDR